MYVFPALEVVRNFVFPSNTTTDMLLCVFFLWLQMSARVPGTYSHDHAVVNASLPLSARTRPMFSSRNPSPVSARHIVSPGGIRHASLMLPPKVRSGNYTWRYQPVGGCKHKRMKAKLQCSTLHPDGIRATGIQSSIAEGAACHASKNCRKNEYRRDQSDLSCVFVYFSICACRCLNVPS